MRVEGAENTSWRASTGNCATVQVVPPMTARTHPTGGSSGVVR